MQTQIVDRIHRRAQLAVQKFRACEVELLDVIEQCEKYRVFSALGYSSLFAYATQNLGLSEDLACSYINISRKSREVPALKSAIADGSITISKANRLTRVMNQENQKHWLEVAKTSSKRALEKLVASENPRAAVVEKINYVSADRLEMQVGISEKLMIQLRRAQDVISQKKRRPVSLEEVIDVICADYLRREDPLEKAERQLAKGKLRDTVPQQPQRLSGPGRIRPPIPSATRHLLTLSSNSQCVYRLPNGKRCVERRFLEIHHVRPLSEGGGHDIENLQILCSAHHQHQHWR